MHSSSIHSSTLCPLLAVHLLLQPVPPSTFRFFRPCWSVEAARTCSCDSPVTLGAKTVDGSMGVPFSRRHIVLAFTTFVAIRSIARIGYRPIDSSIHHENHQERRFLSHPEGIGRPKHDSGNMTASRRSFIDPSSQLFDLVQRWDSSSITIEDAVQVLNDIVVSREYINHKPSQGILFIKTHKTGRYMDLYVVDVSKTFTYDRRQDLRQFLPHFGA